MITSDHIDYYRVPGARTTGEWLEEPEMRGRILRADWDLLTDTDDMHFDTYEAPIFDHTGAEIGTETRGIWITWE